MNRRERRFAQSRQPRTNRTGPGTDPGVLLARGVAHHEAGRLNEAGSVYRRVLTLDSGNADALHLLGLVAHQTGRHDEAARLIGQALDAAPRAAPGVALFHRNMGVALMALRRGDDAIGHYREAAALAPADAETLLHFANALDRMGRAAEAAESYRAALAAGANDAETHVALAVALMKSGFTDDAGEHFSRALELAPDAAFAHANMGRYLFHRDELEASERPLRRAIELNPDCFEALSDLGALLRERDQVAEAIVALERALALRPGDATALKRYGLVLHDAGRALEASDQFRRVAEILPDDAEVRNNLGLALEALDRDDEAIAAYDRAIGLDPDLQPARANRGLVRLARGDFAGGWTDYLARASVRRNAAALHREVLPEDLTGKRVRLFKDQGLGDEILFLRLAKRMKERGAWIAYDPDPKIAGMIRRLPFIDEFVDAGEQAHGYDYGCSIGDLGFLLAMNGVGDIPPPFEIPVLADRDEEMRRRLEDLGPAPRIGITWRAGGQGHDRMSRLSPLERIIDALRPLDATVVVVQRNPKPAEMETLRQSLPERVHDFSRLNDDIEGMLALLGLLDDYVGVSNTNTNLRAARGRSNRVLLSLPAEYFWMASGAESPWFPGSPLYRETADRGWDAAFDALIRDLAAATGHK